MYLTSSMRMSTDDIFIVLSILHYITRLTFINYFYAFFTFLTCKTAFAHLIQLAFYSNKEVRVATEEK